MWIINQIKTVKMKAERKASGNLEQEISIAAAQQKQLGTGLLK